MIARAKTLTCLVFIAAVALVAPNKLGATPNLCRLIETTPPWVDSIRIELEAIRVDGPEGSFLYDPECRNQDHYIWVDDSSVAPSDDIAKAVRSRKSLSGRGDAARVGITVVGWYSPFSGRGFGASGEFLQRVRVAELRDPTTVDDAVPWPSQNPSPVAPRSQAIRRVAELDQRWRDYLAGASERPLDAKELSPRYIVLTDGTVKGGAAYLSLLVRTLPKPVVGRYGSDGGVFSWESVAITSGDIIREACRMSYANTYERALGHWQLVATRLSPCIP